MSTLTIENYVKTIYSLVQKNMRQTAATGEIARALNVSPGTVTSMLKTLSDSGLASYTPYEGVQLTDSGRALALRVLRRHRLIELFLVKTLKVSWDEVHEEAENMEHAVSDLLIDRIDEFLGFPESDPHGDPIPKSDGSISRQESVDLWDLNDGDNFAVVRVTDQDSKFLRYLTEHGLEIGCNGKVISRSVSGATITVKISETCNTISREVASKLQVQPT